MLQYYRPIIQQGQTDTETDVHVQELYQSLI